MTFKFDLPYVMTDLSKSPQLKSLLYLSPGERRRIGEVKGEGSIRQRLLDMGFLPKQDVRLERVALGGAPVWVELNGSHLALRREEAAMILVTNEA
ncbi:MAG: ferrous iron transport protein A [Myxococcales bacterium]|nr:ferrous iron transport protein A [Myxococcales bacterium]